MKGIHAAGEMHSRLVDSLYVEAMLLADEARGYFDDAGKHERDGLDALGRVSFSCESLKVTTRLMHIIAWLLTQRAVQAGEIRFADAMEPSRRLGEAPVSEPEMIERMPPCARALIEASIELYRRTARIEAGRTEPPHDTGPARRMLDRLSHAF